DGGSTGELLKVLPVIALGDLRKCCLSMICEPLLRKRCGGDEKRVRNLVRLFFHLFNYRFSVGASESAVLEDPLSVAPEACRRACPEWLMEEVKDLLSTLKTKDGWVVNPSGHCLGNLILAGAVFQASGGDFKKTPSSGAVQAGLNRVAELIGSPVGRIHAATAVPGQLVFTYTHGVQVIGQSKSGRARRGFPIERVHSTFVREPFVPAGTLRRLREADLIIYAPGSLYTSIIPVLQIPAISQAIQSNQKALKILGANFWAQAGETDMSINNMARPFLVSELIEAYGRNVDCDVRGLFDVVLSADLAHVPGSVLRAYALEDKRPIHLDRSKVEQMKLMPVEVSLFPRDVRNNQHSIKHDADNFAQAIKALAYAGRRGICPGEDEAKRRIPSVPAALSGWRRSEISLCRYHHSIHESLHRKSIGLPDLGEALVQLVWENRDIRAEHLNYFRGVTVVSDKAWTRSREWDNVLGYYNPENEMIYLHQQLLGRNGDWASHFLIALGESLLGDYIRERKLYACEPAGRCYEIWLREAAGYRGGLSRVQLEEFLVLAGMHAAPDAPDVFRMVMNRQAGFLPSGLLFGLMYAWYLDNAFAPAVDFEMGLLRWKPENLLPHQADECRRRRALVDFFRTQVFAHTE
ncbi:MAG: 2-phospho-L-lactate transferase CofD family protein, partial [Kiritimatiellae bacterium]|nr:2-phospho-L-lactate transferase CofD family protein [Kiritimatiellia bacterium]